MQLILAAIIPILLALLAGYGVGRALPRQHTRHASRLLTPLIWLLLFFCGKEFGHVLTAAAGLGQALSTALVFALLTTLLPWGLILCCLPQPRRSKVAVQGSGASMLQLWQALRDCLLALGMVAAGVVASRYPLPWLAAVTSTQLLYVLIVLVGIDLVGVKLGGAWRAPAVMALPLLVVAGSLAGGLLAALFTGQALWTGLALSSGFGWVTLSSILVGSKLGSVYGAIALLVDLFRELIAIAMLYLVGARFSREAIGICGATALDATLPLIRQQCGSQHVSLALISGFVLTLLSPLLIMVCLSATG